MTLTPLPAGSGTVTLDGTRQNHNIGNQPIQQPLQTILELQQLPPTLGAVGTSANASLVTNANGAPQLGSIVINFSPDDLAAALVVLQGKVQDAQLQTAHEGLVGKTKKVDDQKAVTLKKIEEWSSKCRDAAAKSKVQGIFGWIKKAFTVLASCFAVAAAVVVAASTGLTAAPLVILALMAAASAITGLASDIDKEMGGEGFDKIAKKLDFGTLAGMGMSWFLKEVAGVDEKKADLVGAIFSAVVIVGLAAVSIMLSGGSSAAAVTDTLHRSILTVARIGQGVSGVVNGATQATEGGMGIAIAYDKRDADLIQSDQKKTQAIIAQLQQQMAQDREDIQKIIEQMAEGIRIVTQMIGASSMSRAQINANLGRAGHPI